MLESHDSKSSSPNARLPRDHGLSSLALLMQLGGTLGVLACSVVALTGTFVDPLDLPGILFFCGVLCGIRSAYHRAAGTSLLYGEGDAPLRAVYRYLLVSVGQTVFCVILLRQHLPVATVMKVAAAFLAWPSTLAVVFCGPVLRRCARGSVRESEDHGFEGASVLMLGLGVVGALFAATLLGHLVREPAASFRNAADVIAGLAFVVLVGRSLLHIRTGLLGTAGASYDEHLALGRRYYEVGVGSATCLCATTFIVALASSYPANLWVALVASVFIGVSLFAWPSILRRYFMERAFSVYLAGDGEPAFQRAPDAGLSALGWLLLAVSPLAVALATTTIVTSRSVSEAHLAIWLAILASLGSASGIALVRMSKWYRAVALVHAVVTIVVTLGVLWSGLAGLEAIAGQALGGVESFLASLQTGLVYLGLAIAIATLVLISRTTMPAAVARIRQRGV